jgi:hypothetical protein
MKDALAFKLDFTELIAIAGPHDVRGGGAFPSYV